MGLHMLTLGTHARSFCLERTLKVQYVVEGSS